jgi:hypothetical protein
VLVVAADGVADNKEATKAGVVATSSKVVTKAAAVVATRAAIKVVSNKSDKRYPSLHSILVA